MSKKEKNITRKDFIKKSCTGFLGLLTYDILKKSPLHLSNGRGIPGGFRVLGRTGIRLTNVGFGASRTMESSLLLKAIDSGISFIDTGRSYFNGRNEIMVGKALKGIRKNIIIQSKMKVRPRRIYQSSQPSEAIKKIMESSLYTSLKALQTDYIDIMLIHGASDLSDINNETVMEFLSRAKKKGHIRSYGFSCHNEIKLLKWANEKKFYDVIMLPYNHKGAYVHMNSGGHREWNQSQVEIELNKAHKNDLGIVAMKTCSAGPYASNKVEKPSYLEALKWVINHEYVDTMAVAMTNFSQIKEDVQVMKR
jgi:predicted aldo/keto reductase-like oxidoreductase